MRHRYMIWDMTVVLAVASMLVVLALEYKLLVGSGHDQADAVRIEAAEVLLIAFCLGVFLFISARRVRAQESELKRRLAAEENVRELAFQDPLTGLPNRRQFDDVVTAAVAAPPGAERMHAVLLMDLNGFKSINDVFGHPAGDAVLREIGLRLAAALRDTGDHVARLGGDEFGIVATQLRSAEDAAGIALRIIEALKAPVQSGEVKHRVGVGIGVALFPQDGNSAQEIIRRADVALYRAKAEPESSVHFFEEQMDVQIRERALIEGELRNALASGAIQPYYQPVVDLETGKITGFEALARWDHPTLQDMPPSRFIPVAEECGLIRELGDHLLRTACRDACQWPEHTTLSFNVSPVQLRTSNFGSHVLAILRETDFPPHRLEIEITENTLVRDLKAAERALGSLREAGVRIALDDFGTGYSSLYHLRNFKVDRIKIDRSFVESMGREIESNAIIRALLGLGHGLGVQVTAEGIENPEQQAALKSQGCDQGQGFLFSDALPAAEAQALFSAERR
ncbi:putative bifunctional diguanylate cyclase/phosphodiesterase [Microvirga sp. 2TAF3]|uniref:putative bifunctional diguanylate cyclase/phosphodiesterase n=1 Tax=Microvirga sp. 2TAF3 TaxID=3233014 RepID=UPI003F9E6BAC